MNQFILVLILSLFLNNFARANETETLALITNVDTPKNYCCWVRICTQTTPDLAVDLEKIFRNKLSWKKYALEVYHRPSQYELYQLFKSKRFKAIFFVSHSVELDTRGQTGVIALDRIPNHEQADIKPIIRHVTTDFFAFCGCYSQTHLDDLFTSQVNAPAQLFGFPGVINAKSALRKSINKFLSHSNHNRDDLPTEANTLSSARNNIKVRAKRSGKKSDSSLPAIQISVNGSLVAMMPETNPQEDQMTEFTIEVPGESLTFETKRELKLLTITVSNGFNSMDFSRPIPGELEFSSPDVPGYWQVYRRSSTGDIMGHNTNLYYFKR